MERRMMECRRILGRAVLDVMEWRRSREVVSMLRDRWDLRGCGLLVYSVICPIDAELGTGHYDIFYQDAEGVLRLARSGDPVWHGRGRRLERPEDFEDVELTSLMRLYDHLYDPEGECLLHSDDDEVASPWPP